MKSSSYSTLDHLLSCVSSRYVRIRRPGNGNFAAPDQACAACRNRAASRVR
ncbi:hypothetical protein ACFPM0_18005 [Pseudonocardia sulfidoxydans]|uniref:hypothetical protein n=1 Tax=Pseudonocardia sulfidoxydans TaxID=54011 RepID=UPI00361D3233